MPDACLLHDALAGRWSFRRHASSGEHMQGVAGFQPQARGLLRYHEEGRVFLPNGRELSFFRKYLYRIDGTVMTILFDGPSQGLFQRVVLARRDGVWTGRGHHPCGRDIYLTDYRIAAGALPSLGIRHRVTGPNKDYLLETLYRRDDGAG